MTSELNEARKQKLTCLQSLFYFLASSCQKQKYLESATNWSQDLFLRFYFISYRLNL